MKPDVHAQLLMRMVWSVSNARTECASINSTRATTRITVAITQMKMNVLTTFLKS